MQHVHVCNVYLVKLLSQDVIICKLPLKLVSSSPIHSACKSYAGINFDKINDHDIQSLKTSTFKSPKKLLKHMISHQCNLK